MITKLTKKQETLIPKYVKKGLEIGLGTERMDRDRVKELVHKLYKAHGLEPVPVFFFDSPLSGLAAIKVMKKLFKKENWDQLWDQLMDQLWDQLMDQLGGQLMDQLWDQLRGQLRDQLMDQLGGQLWDQLRDQLGGQLREEKVEWENGFLWGSQELYWLYFYKFINDELDVKKCTAPINETIELCEQVGWFWPYKNICVVTEKPTSIHMANKKLHRTEGPSVEFADGFKVHSLNGILFSGDMEKFVTIPVEKLDAKEVLSIKNVEQRSEAIKKFGIDKLFWDLKPTKLHAENGYELYSVPVYEDMPRIYLKMQNPSIDEVHIEAVHPDVKTVPEALHWRNFGSVTIPKNTFIPPIILT